MVDDDMMSLSIRVPRGVVGDLTRAGSISGYSMGIPGIGRRAPDRSRPKAWVSKSRDCRRLRLADAVDEGRRHMGKTRCPSNYSFSSHLSLSLNFRKNIIIK